MQQLRELHLSGLAGIPPAVFLAAPLLSFSATELDSRVEGFPSASTIQGLILHPRTEDVYSLFARPQYASALRRVAIDPQHGYTRALIFSAAPSLEQITFYCMRGSHSFLP